MSRLRDCRVIVSPAVRGESGTLRRCQLPSSTWAGSQKAYLSWRPVRLQNFAPVCFKATDTYDERWHYHHIGMVYEIATYQLPAYFVPFRRGTVAVRVRGTGFLPVEVCVLPVSTALESLYRCSMKRKLRHRRLVHFLRYPLRADDDPLVVYHQSSWWPWSSTGSMQAMKSCRLGR